MQSQVGLRKHHYKASRCDRIPFELFQNLKDGDVKVLHSIYQQVWKTQQWLQDSKWSVSNQEEGRCQRKFKLLTAELISQASKVMLKILQARLQQYINCEIPDVQAGFRKGRGTRDQIANICWIIKKARVFQINMYFSFIYYDKAFDLYGSQQTVENS